MTDSTATEAKHTPGPWGVDPENQHDIYGSTTSPETMELLASAYPMKRDGLYNSWKANARLIAAAPAMLEALTLLTDTAATYQQSHTTDCDCGFCESFKRADAAIALAKGQSNDR